MIENRVIFCGFYLSKVKIDLCGNVVFFFCKGFILGYGDFFKGV